MMPQIHHPAISDLHIDAGRRRGFVCVPVCVRGGGACVCLWCVVTDTLKLLVYLMHVCNATIPMTYPSASLQQ